MLKSRAGVDCRSMIWISQKRAAALPGRSEWRRHASRRRCRAGASGVAAHRRRQARPAGHLAGAQPCRRTISRITRRVTACPPGRSVVEGGTIPYQPWAAAKKRENFANRATADPLAECYMPGVPRIMYMEFPFQIFQTRDHVAMLFEWQQVYRLIYTNGSRPPEGITFWMGDSRGRWEGDTLVVDVTNHNDRTWFDMAGNFHSDALHVTERYTMVGRRHHRLRGDDRGCEGLHAAVEDPHAAPSAEGDGARARVSMPRGARRSAR